MKATRVVDFIAVRPSDQQLYDLRVLIEGDDGEHQVLLFEGTTQFIDGERTPTSVEFVEELAAQLGGRFLPDVTGG